MERGEEKRRMLLLYDVNATEARNYENVYQKLSIIPNSSKLNTI